MEYPLVTARVDLDAVGQNIRNLKKLTAPSAAFMAVVKADGYGHGAVKVALKALDSGADWLGVARVHEAIGLRRAGIRAPILVFGYVHPDQVATVLENDLTITVYSLDMAKKLSDKAAALNQNLKTHLKVDTGMGRVGMIVSQDLADRAALDRNIEEIGKMAALKGIDLQGIYTHFAAADSSDPSYTRLQIRAFEALMTEAGKNRILFKFRHAANSAGIISFPNAHFDMVRAGISIYGLYPSPEVDRALVALSPAMTLTTIITAVRTVPKGFCVSYGMTHRTEKETRLASVPIGYADGFSRRFSSNGVMLVRGQRAPVVGRVCMDQTLLDVGHIPGVASGDEVVVIGSQKAETLGADELAARVQTINYEIVSALTPRVKRVYLDAQRSDASGSDASGAFSG